MENNKLNFEIKREFGKGVEPRDYATTLERIGSLKKEEIKCAENVSRLNSRWKDNPTAKNKNLVEKALAELDEITEERNKIEINLSNGVLFADNTTREEIGFMPCDSAIDLCGIYNCELTVKKNGVRLVVENYDEFTAPIVAEGDIIPDNDLIDFVHTIDTDDESLARIAHGLKVSLKHLNDDKLLQYNATDSVNEKHTKNTKTMLLCEKIRTSKGARAITVNTLASIVNDTLSPIAKQRADIIVNEDSYNKLDTKDENGNAYIKKDFATGEMIFADRFIIRTIPNGILSNNEDGTSPVFVGDWKNILRLAVVKKYPVLKADDTDFASVKKAFRYIESVIPLLTTTSDKAFIIGALA